MADIHRTRETKKLLKSQDALIASETFREKIFELYDLKPTARMQICEKSNIIVLDFDSSSGGGSWWPPEAKPFSSLVQLYTTQHEAAVHEFAHVFWHYWRLSYPTVKEDLVRNLIKLADMNPEEHPECKDAILFAHGYVYGGDEWIGMLGNADYTNNSKNLPKDIYNLTEKDFEKRINDWEIFAGLASYTMGQFSQGPRQLPKFMWATFQMFFSGNIRTVPYYMGGHP